MIEYGCDFLAEKPPNAEGITPEKPTFRCPHCSQSFESSGELGRHLWAPESEGGHKEKMIELQKAGRAKKAEEDARKIAEEEAKKKGAPPTPMPPKPPRIAAQDEAIDYLASKLPDIYGMSPQGARSAIERLRERPEIVWDLNALYYHIKQYAGKQVNEYDLRWLLSSVQSRLSQVGEAPQPPFVVQPPQQPYQPFMPSPYPQAPTPQFQPQIQVPQPWFTQPYQPQPYAQPPYPPQYQPYQPRSEKTYKLVVDGQEIETDEKGFMAWKRYLDEQKKPSERPLTKAEIEDIMLKTKTDLAGAFSETLKQDRGEREKEREKESLTEVIRNLPGQITEAVAKTKKEEELPKAIAEAVAKAVPRPPAQPAVPPLTKEDVAEMVKGVAKESRDEALRIIEAREKEDREERRHQELMKAQQETQAAIRSSLSAQQVSGYREDSYRLLGQGLSSLAGAVERKEPIKIILEKGPEILYGPAPPGPKEIMPGATGAEMAGRLGRLRPEWIAPE